MTVILGLLAQMDQCESFIIHSKGDLLAKKFFSSVGEQFSEHAYGHPMGLRNADNDWRLDQVSDEIYELSQVFTGAFYDILGEIFEIRQNSEEVDDVHVLWEVGQYMTDTLLGALLKGPAENATFADIANLMIRHERNKEYQIIIKQHFTMRRIIGPHSVEPFKRLRDSVTSRLWESCRGTLATDEHLDLVDSILEKQRQNSWMSRGIRKSSAS